MNEKKVLIITYYWPPSGGSGVQRWLKFVKYLPDFAVKPYVFTPANPSFDVKDESLLKDVPPEAEVIHFPIWEPYNLFLKFSKLLGNKSATAKPTDLVAGEKKSKFQSISTWVRGNLFVPDPRKFWVRPSARYLNNYLRDNNITTVITTGPPHSVHLIGYRLKKKNPSLRWLADFRDPWSTWGFLDSLMLGKVAWTKHRALENKVLLTADEVITITPFYQRSFANLGKRKITLLTNGFDENDFRELQYKKSDRFLIRHVGIINEKCDPRPFLTALAKLMDTNPAFKEKVSLEFIGEVHQQVKHFIQESDSLKKIAIFTGNVPHKRLISQYGESSLLLLILTGYKDAEGFMPGKLFEYMATGLPILAVGPTTGDAAGLLAETKAGVMIGSNDQVGITRCLEETFNAWKISSDNRPIPNQAHRYSRRQIASQLADLI